MRLRWEGGVPIPSVAVGVNISPTILLIPILGKQGWERPPVPTLKELILVDLVGEILEEAEHLVGGRIHIRPNWREIATGQT